VHNVERIKKWRQIFAVTGKTYGLRHKFLVLGLLKERPISDLWLIRIRCLKTIFDVWNVMREDL